METSNENGLRLLPNGMWMEEATGEDGMCKVVQVLGTRIKYNYRYWLLKFDGHDRLMWIGARGCRCGAAIKTFMKKMHWGKPPKEPDVEYLDPDLEQPAALQAGPQPPAYAPQNPPPAAPAVASEKKGNIEKTQKAVPVIPLSGLEEEEDGQNEDRPSKTASKRSHAATPTASEPTAFRGRGNKSKPSIGPQNTTRALTKSVEDLGALDAAALPPKPGKQIPAEQAQQEEIAEPPEKEASVNQDEGEQTMKASKRAHGDSSKTQEPSTSGGVKKTKLFSGIPNAKPVLAVMSASRVKDDNAYAAAPQLNLRVAATANAAAKVTPTTDGAASAAVASPTQQSFGFQTGLQLLAILDVRREAGRTVAEVRYDDGSKELVPTVLLSQHEPKLLNAFYADRDKPTTSDN